MEQQQQPADDRQQRGRRVGPLDRARPSSSPTPPREPGAAGRACVRVEMGHLRRAGAALQRIIISFAFASASVPPSRGSLPFPYSSSSSFAGRDVDHGSAVVFGDRGSRSRGSGPHHGRRIMPCPEADRSIRACFRLPRVGNDDSGASPCWGPGAGRDPGILAPRGPGPTAEFICRMLAWSRGLRTLARHFCFVLFRILPRCTLI